MNKKFIFSMGISIVLATSYAFADTVTCPAQIYCKGNSCNATDGNNYPWKTEDVQNPTGIANLNWTNARTGSAAGANAECDYNDPSSSSSASMVNNNYNDPLGPLGGSWTIVGDPNDSFSYYTCKASAATCTFTTDVNLKSKKKVQ